MIENCPCCCGAIGISVCGREEHGVSMAVCHGHPKCKRQWKIEGTKSVSNAISRWNKMQREITRRLMVIDMIRFKAGNNDFQQELSHEAKRLIDGLKEQAICPYMAVNKKAKG